MGIWFYSLASVFVVSLVSLIGVFTLSFEEKKLKKTVLFLVSFAVGALFGDALIHLIPETFDKIHSKATASLFILFGILIFFGLEKFVRWRHCHIAECDEHASPIASVNIFGNIVHNFIDGMLIGASYLVSLPLGFATTIAILLHEIPQEIGNFAVLVHSGYTTKKAIAVNFFSALIAFAGVAIALLVGDYASNFTVFLLPVTAGGFLYIAGSDLIPELKHETKIAASIGQLFAIILGIAVMASFLFVE
ncbi:MAG: ZIP family metal transporter [Patescibacteria group bacterium]|nr:ZIP family metal transporter [Patescibacteria group bacterium]